jgi:hypothetical protein
MAKAKLKVPVEKIVAILGLFSKLGDAYIFHFTFSFIIKNKPKKTFIVIEKTVPLNIPLKPSFLIASKIKSLYLL